MVVGQPGSQTQAAEVVNTRAKVQSATPTRGTCCTDPPPLPPPCPPVALTCTAAAVCLIRRSWAARRPTAPWRPRRLRPHQAWRPPRRLQQQQAQPTAATLRTLSNNPVTFRIITIIITITAAATMARTSRCVTPPPHSVLQTRLTSRRRRHQAPQSRLPRKAFTRHPPPRLARL